MHMDYISTNIKPLFAGIMTAVVIMLIAWQIDNTEIKQFREEHRAQVVEDLSTLRARLEAALNSRLHLIHGLSAFAKTQPDFNERQFYHFSKELQGEQKGIRSLQLAPHAVIRYVYPSQENQAAMGHDLLSDPAHHAVVKKVIEERKYIIAGPMSLDQGDISLIGRRTVFFPSETGERFWGLAIIILDLEPLLREAGFFEFSENVQLSLRGKDSLGAKGDVFYGNPDLFTNKLLITQNISLPNGSWQLAALPGSASHNWAGRTWLWSSGIFLALAFGGLSFFVIQQPIHLRRTIDQATALLRIQTKAMEATATSIMLTDKYGIIHWVNPAFSKMTGYSASEAVGQNPKILKSGRQSKDYYRQLQATIRSGLSWHGELINKRKDNSLYYEQASITPIFDEDGNISSFVSIKEDITEQKQANEALSFHRMQLKTILDNVVEGIVSVNQQFNITSANPAIEKMFGFSSEELIGENINILVPLPHKNVHNRYIENYLANQENHEISPINTVVFDKELRAKRKDGSQLSLEVTVNHVQFEETTLTVPQLDDSKFLETQFIVTLRDISERKKAEKTLAETREKFFLQEKMASIGTLAAGIIHEVGNPISAISGLVNEIMMLNESLNDESRGNIELIQQQIARLSSITQEVAEFSAPQTDEIQLFSLNSLVQSACRLVRFDKRMRQVDCQLDLDPNLPAVNGSTTQIQQVLINVLINAADAVENRKHPSITIQTIVEDPWVKMTVADNGIGMDKQTLACVFDAFFTTKAVGKGTGLGLSLCYSIVEEHGGHVNIDSTLDKGTSVTIYLPTTEHV